MHFEGICQQSYQKDKREPICLPVLRWRGEVHSELWHSAAWDVLPCVGNRELLAMRDLLEMLEGVGVTILWPGVGNLDKSTGLSLSLLENGPADGRSLCCWLFPLVGTDGDAVSPT